MESFIDVYFFLYFQYIINMYYHTLRITSFRIEELSHKSSDSLYTHNSSYFGSSPTCLRVVNWDLLRYFGGTFFGRQRMAVLV
jgi:hypothetical protein